MPEVVDLFLIGGQSNAEGTGDPDCAPAVSAEDEYVPDAGALVHLKEPVGEGDGAASLAAFAREYHDLTGRPVIVVPTAVGGSAQHADGGNGHWDDGGELCSSAITAVRPVAGTSTARGSPRVPWRPLASGRVVGDADRRERRLDRTV